MKPTPEDFRFWRDARASPQWAVRMKAQAVTTRADVVRALHAAINSHDPRTPVGRRREELEKSNAVVFVRGVRDRIAKDGRAQVAATEGHGFRWVATLHEYMAGHPQSRGHHSTEKRNVIYRRWLRRMVRP